MLPDFDNINTVLPGVIAAAGPALPKGTYSEALNVLHIGFSKYGDKNEDECSKIAKDALANFKSQITAMDVRAVNFLTVKPGKKVSYFNYFAENNYQEDIVSRNMRPTMPQLLELNRLVENHELARLPTVGRNSQLYLGVPKVDSKGKKSDQQYLFLRSISNTAETVSADGAERVLVLAMDELDRALLDSRVSDSVSSRVFLNILPDATMDVKEGIELFQRSMDALISKYATRLLKLRVDEIEVKVRVKDPKEGIIPVRCIASSSEGGWLTRMAYREYLDPVSGQTTQYCPLIGNQDMCVLDPYPAAGVLQFKRSNARRVGSTYAYDFLGLMEVALINSWQSYLENSGGVPPATLFKSEELVLGADNVLRKEKRVPGSNKVGMLAWHCTMKTPQYPEGRDVVIIANDVTGEFYI
jgi:acetyl-CoA carboxylase/biotin carboxylase 1